MLSVQRWHSFLIYYLYHFKIGGWHAPTLRKKQYHLSPTFDPEAHRQKKENPVLDTRTRKSWFMPGQNVQHAFSHYQSISYYAIYSLISSLSDTTFVLSSTLFTWLYHLRTFITLSTPLRTRTNSNSIGSSNFNHCFKVIHLYPFYPQPFHLSSYDMV